MGREGAQARQGFEGVGPGGFGQGVGADAAQLGDVVGDAGQLGGGVAALGVITKIGRASCRERV